MEVAGWKERPAPQFQLFNKVSKVFVVISASTVPSSDTMNTWRFAFMGLGLPGSIFALKSLHR